MTSPFLLDVSSLQAADAPERRSITGPSPERIGVEMIALPEGAPVTVEALLTPLGGAVMVDADISAELSGECARCLRTLHPREELHLNRVYLAAEDDAADPLHSEPGAEAEEGDDEDEVLRIHDDRIDLLQPYRDELGLSLPFNPTCPDGCEDSGTGVPSPDGVSGERPEDAVDPRWAGLEKFL